MAVKAFITDLSHTLLSMFEHGEALWDINRLLLSHIPERAMHIIHNIDDAASQYIAHAAPRLADLVGPAGHETANHQQIYDIEAADQHATVRRNRSIRALLTLSRRIKTWMAILVVLGVISLIVVPCLVLGVVKKQLLWGIGLCGLIVAVLNLFASFYYHIDG